MAYQGKRRRGGASWDRGGRRSRRFDELKAHHITYKNERLLRRFLSERGKIIPRRITGISSKHQRLVCQAIKRARHLAILPFVEDTVR